MKFIILFFAILLSPVTYGQDYPELVSEAEDFYKAGSYEQSVKRYQPALQIDP